MDLDRITNPTIETILERHPHIPNELSLPGVK